MVRFGAECAADRSDDRHSEGPENGSGCRARTGGGGYRYGWLEVTWDGTDWAILSGAYESDLNTAILAGATGGGAVPLPGAAGLAACGLLGMSRRRRR